MVSVEEVNQRPGEEEVVQEPVLLPAEVQGAVLLPAEVQGACARAC